MIFHALPVARFSIILVNLLTHLLVLCGRHWFKVIFELSAQFLFSSPLPWPKPTMAEDWQMESEDASAQVLQAFQSLAPLLDGSLKLTTNPGATKRQKVDAQSDKKKDKPTAESSNLLPAIQLMAKLVISLDRDQQLQKKEDTYLFFFNSKEPTGSLGVLQKAAEEWHHQATLQPSSPSKTPLRQKLLQTLLIDLMDRIQKLADAPPESPLMQKAVQSMILLPDRTFPYLEWDHTTKALQISKRTPISLQKMHQHCTELLDMFRDPSIILRFHALPTKPESAVSPWRLQVSLRADRPWELLQALCQSSVWTLMATSLKQHSRFQSPLALKLEESLGLKSMKGTGKGSKGHKGSKGPSKLQTTKKE